MKLRPIKIGEVYTPTLEHCFDCYHIEPWQLPEWLRDMMTMEGTITGVVRSEEHRDYAIERRGVPGKLVTICGPNRPHWWRPEVDDGC
jgi:hypothetical protein